MDSDTRPDHVTLDRLTAIHGTAAAIAGVLGVTPAVVRQWKSRGTIASASRQAAQAAAWPARAPAPAPGDPRPAPDLAASASLLSAMDAALARPEVAEAHAQAQAAHPLLAGWADATRRVRVTSGAFGLGWTDQLASTDAVRQLAEVAAEGGALVARDGIAVLRVAATASAPSMIPTWTVYGQNFWRYGFARGTAVLGTIAAPGLVAEWIAGVPLTGPAIESLIAFAHKHTSIGTVAEVERSLSSPPKAAPVTSWAEVYR